MKYVLSWRKRRHGTTLDFEDGQRRVLQLVREWRRPEGVLIHQFVMKVGEPGGFVVFEADDLAVVRRETAAFSMLNFQIDPVVDLEEGLAAMEAGAVWRDSVM